MLVFFGLCRPFIVNLAIVRLYSVWLYMKDVVALITRGVTHCLMYYIGSLLANWKFIDVHAQDGINVTSSIDGTDTYLVVMC